MIQYLAGSGIGVDPVVFAQLGHPIAITDYKFVRVGRCEPNAKATSADPAGRHDIVVD